MNLRAKRLAGGAIAALAVTALVTPQGAVAKNDERPSWSSV